MSKESVFYRHVAPEYELVITCPSDMLEESVVYQDIFQKGEQRGEQRGLQQGAEQEARKLAMRLLARRFGKPSRAVRRQIEQFVAEQLEALCEALIDLKTKDDLARWLEQHAPQRRNEA